MAKAQVALEYLIIVGLGLMIILPYILYSNQLLVGYKGDNSVTLARVAVNKLGQSADWVFSQGEPAMLSTEIYIPDGVTSVQFLNSTLVFKVRTSAGVSDVFYTSTANLTGNIPTTSGYYVVNITAQDSTVRITV